MFIHFAGTANTLYVRRSSVARYARALSACLLLLAPLGVGAQHSTATSAGARPAFSPSREAGQFDFLIGQWDLTVIPKVNSLAAKIHGSPKYVGLWKAWRAMDGFGIEDELRIMDRSGNPSALTHSVRVYSVNEHQWLTTAVDAYRGRVTASRGEQKGTELITTSEGRDESGKTYINRSRFYAITPSAFNFQQDRSFDGGKTWDVGTLKISAKRAAASATR